MEKESKNYQKEWYAANKERLSIKRKEERELKYERLNPEGYYNIYALLNSKGQPFYIGKTKMQIEDRIKIKYNEEVQSIKENENTSYMLLEQTHEASRERYWIDFYRNQTNSKLLNIQKGDGLDYKTYRREYYRIWREENREKYTEYQKEYQKTYDIKIK